jgi:hypothetical protein
VQCAVGVFFPQKLPPTSIGPGAPVVDSVQWRAILFPAWMFEKQRLQTAEAMLVESTLNQRELVFVHKSFFDDECSREGSEPFRQLLQGPSDRPVRNRSAILQSHYRAALSKAFRNLVAIRACVVRAALQSMNSSLARIFASLVNSKQVLPSTEVTFKPQALRDLVA